MSHTQELEKWEEEERKRRLHHCDNPEYLANLILALKQAKRDKNIELVIAYARELENAKILCGASPMIEAFEHTLKDVAIDFNLLNNPTVQRGLAPAPTEKLCPFCTKCAKRMLTMEGFTPLEVYEDGTRSLFIPKEEPVKIIALRALQSKEVTDWQDPIIKNQNVPTMCDPSQCSIESCSNRFNREAWGILCKYRTPPNTPSQFEGHSPLVTKEALMRQLDKTDYVTNAEANRQNYVYPDVCSPACPRRTCAFYTQENFNKSCQMKTDEFKPEERKF